MLGSRNRPRGGARKDGLWSYRKRWKSNDSDAPARDTRHYVGLIADYAPHLLVQVRDDQMTATGRVGARARTACGATESVRNLTIPMVPPAITVIRPVRF